MPLWFYSEGERVVIITFKSHREATASAASHTFTSMGLGTTGIAIACLGWQSSATSTVSSVTIGGVTAAVSIAPVRDGGSRELALYIASGVVATVGDIVLSISTTALNWACASYQLDGSVPVAASTATNISTTPHASMSCNAHGAILGAGIAGAASSPACTWAGIAEDSDNNYGGSNLQDFSAAHTNFTAAQSGLVCTATFSPVAAAAGIFAAFNPS